ncbi:Phd finger protein, partial [Globisporangium splendens]
MEEETRRFSLTSLQRLQQHSLFRFQIQDAEVGASVAELLDILMSGRDLPDHFEILTELVHGIEDQIQDSDTRELYLLASLQHFTQEMGMLLEMDNEAELNPDDMPSFAAIFARESGDKQRSRCSKANSVSTNSAGSTAKKVSAKPAIAPPISNSMPSRANFFAKQETNVPPPATLPVAAAPAIVQQTLPTAPMPRPQQKSAPPVVQTSTQQQAQQLRNTPSSSGKTKQPSAGIPAVANAAPGAEEDVACSVCFEGDSIEGDAIVICELCNTAVHQTCYRIEYLPEGDWYCHPCSRYLKEQDIEKNVTPPHELECVACMTKGGAMVPTVEGKWMHMSCSMFLPELYVRRVGTQGEVICGVEKLAARRKLRCCFCKKTGCLAHQQQFLSQDGLNVEDGNEVEFIAAASTSSLEVKTPVSSAQEKKKVKSDKKKEKKKPRANSWEESDDDNEYITVSSGDGDDYMGESGLSGDDGVQVMKIMKNDQKTTGTNRKRQLKAGSSGAKVDTKKSRQGTLSFAMAKPNSVTPVATQAVVSSSTGAASRLVPHSRVFMPAYYPPGLRNNDGDKDYEYVMVLIQSLPIGMVITSKPTSYGSGIFFNASKTFNPVVAEAVARGVIQDGDEVFAMNQTVLRNVYTQEVHNIIPKLTYPMQCWFRTKRRTPLSTFQPSTPALNTQQNDLKRVTSPDETKQDREHPDLKLIKDSVDHGASDASKADSSSTIVPGTKPGGENEGLSVDWPWFYLRSDGKVAMNLFWRSLDGAFFLTKINKRVMLDLQNTIETIVGVHFSRDHPEYNQVQELLAMPKRERIPEYLVEFRKARKQKQKFLSSNIFMGVSAESLNAEVEIDEQTPIAIGTIVTVAKRTWAGINKLGGAGRVKKVHEESLDGGKTRFTYDIAYVLGGGEKKVERKYISVVDLDKEAKEKEQESNATNESGNKTDEEDDDATPLKMRLSLQLKTTKDETLLLALSALAVNKEQAPPPQKKTFEFQVSTANGNVYLERKTQDASSAERDLLLHKHFDVKLSDEDTVVKACFQPTLVSADERSMNDVDDSDDEGASDHDEEDEIKTQLESLQNEFSAALSRSQEIFATIKADIEREYAAKEYRKKILEEIQWKHCEQMYRETVAARDQFDDSDDENENSDDEAVGGRQPGSSQQGRSKDPVSSDDDDEESEDETFGGLFVNKIKQEGDEICVLCELSGGDFAATSCGHVVHPQCAMYTPETYFKDGVAHGVEDVPAARRTLSCAICHGRKGLSKIQCANKRCTVAYHISCAYINGLLIRDPHYQAWCPKHLKSSGMADEVELPKHLSKTSSRSGGQSTSKDKKRATQGKKGRRETPQSEATAPNAMSSSKTNRKRKRKSSIRSEATVNPGNTEKPDDNERRCARRLDINADSGAEQDSGTVNATPVVQQIPQQVFQVNDVVLVLAREWIGSNKPGGVARVRAVHKVDNSGKEELFYDVAYVLTNAKEKRVEAEYIRAYQKMEQSDNGASNRKKTRNA